MQGYQTSFREVAKHVASTAHFILMSQCNDPLDGDQTQELSNIFLKEMNKLNGNDEAEEVEAKEGEEMVLYKSPTGEGIYCPFCKTFIPHTEGTTHHKWDCPECLFQCVEDKNV